MVWTARLDPFTILVCDTAGALSIAGVMGGAESEVSDKTRSILLEGAAWNFINIRKTVGSQHLQSEAAFRFSRGIHPALAPWGVALCLEYMRRWAGGQVAQGLIDNYPLPAVDPEVSISTQDVARGLGISLPVEEIADILERLSFAVKVDGQTVHAKTPPYRLDIGDGVIGQANLVEEIARIYGYDHIPGTRLRDELPPQRNNPALEGEERVRDLLVSLGLQEVITYRLTTPEREARLLPPGIPADARPYVRLKNPISPERAVMRHSLLSSVMEVVERNYRLSSRLALFEIGPVFLPTDDQVLPQEPRHLALVLTGLRQLPHRESADIQPMDFFDLKGVLEALCRALHLAGVRFQPGEQPTFHPGKCARLLVGETVLGELGELHPLVKDRLGLGGAPVLAAELDLEVLLACLPASYTMRPVPAFPPVLEDIAVIVEETLPAGEIEVCHLTGRRPDAGRRAPVRYLPRRADRGGKEKSGLQPHLPILRPHPDRPGCGPGAPAHCAPPGNRFRRQTAQRVDQGSSPMPRGCHLDGSARKRCCPPPRLCSSSKPSGLIERCWPSNMPLMPSWPGSWRLLWQ